MTATKGATTALGTMRAKSTSPTARAPSASYATTLSATSEAHSAAWKPPHASSARRRARFVHSSTRAASRALFVVVPTAGEDLSDGARRLRGGQHALELAMRMLEHGH